MRNLMLLGSGVAAMLVWLLAPLPERVRLPVLAWAVVVTTVWLIKSERQSEPSYTAGFVDGYDAATGGRKASRTHTA
ncbi:hypothetical protein [Actinomadura sp. 3N508]|uniref:hypothetical protein n=1 Tax=Actinomadura sp. 3N508 TaxID=3375153 RepID=UPI00378A6EFA